MINAQESPPFALLQEAANNLTRLAGESFTTGPLGPPFARLAESASLLSTSFPKHFLSKQAGSKPGKTPHRPKFAPPKKSLGPALPKVRHPIPANDLETNYKRSKTFRDGKQAQLAARGGLCGEASFRFIDQGLHPLRTDGARYSLDQRRANATLSLSQAAFGSGTLGVEDGQRTWHRADFVFEDELSKGPDVQWFLERKLSAEAKRHGVQESPVLRQARRSQESIKSAEADVQLSDKKHVQKGWQFKRAERQAQITQRLDKLNKKSGLLKQLASGAFAGVVSRSFVAPLDLIKTHLVTGHGSRGASKSAAVVAARIFEEGGWKGFFRGNGINCLRVAPCKAIELCVFENLKRALSKDEGSALSFVAAPIAGGAAGMLSTIATYPLELMRTRMMVQPHLYKSISHTFNKIVAEEGLGALYSGLRPSVLGVFPYAAANYGVYAGLRSAYKRVTKKDYVPTVPTLLFGAAAASASSALTFPLEVARRQMQLGTVGGKAIYKSAINVVQTIYAEEGFFALYRGLGTTCVKLIPAAAVSCMCYEAARLALRVDDASIKKRESEKEALKEEKEGLALQTEAE